MYKNQKENYYVLQQIYGNLPRVRREAYSRTEKLDISPGNLKRWEGGASITAETLEKISNYFGVPVDYFFLKDDEKVFAEIRQNEMAIKDDKNGIRQIYNVARIQPDYIASVLSGRELTESELERVAGYLRCKKVYLLNRNIAEEEKSCLPKIRDGFLRLSFGQGACY